MTNPIRVLHIVGSMTPGGMENFIMNIYEQIDRDKIQFDVAQHMVTENDYTAQIEEMGGRVYQLPRFLRNPVSNLAGLYRLVRKNRYKVVIRHTANASVAPQLMAARLAGAYTICHAHSETAPHKLAHMAGRLLMDMAANARFACSPRAGKWMYGKKKYRLVQNAVNIKKFEYNPDAERRIREEFGLGDRRVYGYIANLKESKNHMYLLDIFSEILKLDPDAMLVCVGEGDMREAIEQRIRQLGMEGRVVLPGVRPDVEAFMSCFDALVFPSKYEGLPLTMIEAQAAGLPCLMSDVVTPEVIVTKGLVEPESLDSKPQVWAKRAYGMAMRIPSASKAAGRACQYEAIAKAGYDSKKLAGWYEDYFFRVVTGKKS